MLVWEAARTRIGKPWMEGGRDTPGVDCFGLVKMSTLDAGIDLDPENQYSRRTPPLKMAKRLLEFAELILPVNVAVRAGFPDMKELNENRLTYQASDLLPSDVLVYQRPAEDVHLGIVTPGDLSTPLKVVYSAFRQDIREVPIQVTGYQFRWVFRFPNQV